MYSSMSRSVCASSLRVSLTVNAASTIALIALIILDLAHTAATSTSRIHPSHLKAILTPASFLLVNDAIVLVYSGPRENAPLPYPKYQCQPT
ncbi:hypothetical protein KC367_g238 [Hortaea werneckii]|nr:hypothetical protein KC367_g238 [Hortaea werneckii]